MLCCLCDWLLKACGWCFVVSLVTYLALFMIRSFAFKEQDLKKKYGANWALVTGGSSGIGRALAEKLAAQGLNLIIAAYPDDMLPKAEKELKAAYPSIEIRVVSVNLAVDNGDYMKALTEATKDIAVQIVFSNAGYIKTGFFTDVTQDQQIANHTCNATSGVRISHHFIKQMQEKKLKGCVVFTSSPASLMPCPFSALYGATKAFITEFATSIAPEVKCDGIDVCVCNPSPVTSNFYKGTHNLDALAMFKKTGTTPAIIASTMLSTVGRLVVADQGYYSLTMRILLKVVDVTFMTELITRMAFLLPDFRKMRAEAAATKAAAAQKKD